MNLNYFKNRRKVFDLCSTYLSRKCCKTGQKKVFQKKLWYSRNMDIETSYVVFIYVLLVQNVVVDTELYT